MWTDGALKIKRMWVEAKIIRPDGTVQDLGVISDTQSNLWTKAKTWLLSLL